MDSEKAADIPSSRQVPEATRSEPSSKAIGDLLAETQMSPVTPREDEDLEAAGEAGPARRDSCSTPDGFTSDTLSIIPRLTSP